MNKWVSHARKQAHDEFDRLWKEGYMSREDAYTWLAERLNLPRRRCHIAQLNESQCFDVEKTTMKKLKQMNSNKEKYD